MMVVIGLIVLAVAVAAAIVLIAQNQTAMVDAHGLGYTWHFHLYWVLVAGLVIAVVGLVGVAIMRAGAVHATQVRRERHGLARENARLSNLAEQRETERDREPGRPVVIQQPVAPEAVESTDATGQHAAQPAAYQTNTDYATPRERRHLFHRTRQV